MTTDVLEFAEPQQIALLEQFLVGNTELDRLDALTNRFNFFDATGIARAELRHSDFLAFLLNPRANHGLGDVFLRRFLQSAARYSTDLGGLHVPVLQLELRDLSRCEISREWHNIDVFILDRPNQMALIIENKVDAAESPGQLARYWSTVSERFPDFTIGGLFLTRDGAPASDTRFASMPFREVHDITGWVRRKLEPGKDVQTVLSHYEVALERFPPHHGLPGHLIGARCARQGGVHGPPTQPRTDA